MSGRSDWRCKSCGTPLGEVVNGKLRPSIVAEETDAYGASRYTCPACGREKRWFPTAPRTARPVPRANVRADASEILATLSGAL